MTASCVYTTHMQSSGLRMDVKEVQTHSCHLSNHVWRFLTFWLVALKQ